MKRSARTEDPSLVNLAVKFVFVSSSKQLIVVEVGDDVPAKKITEIMMFLNKR